MKGVQSVLPSIKGRNLLWLPRLKSTIVTKRVKQLELHFCSIFSRGESGGWWCVGSGAHVLEAARDGRKCGTFQMQISHERTLLSVRWKPGNGRRRLSAWRILQDGGRVQIGLSGILETELFSEIVLPFMRKWKFPFKLDRLEHMNPTFGK